jgi:acyl carrier protein
MGVTALNTFTDTRRILEQNLGITIQDGDNPSRQTMSGWDSLKHVEILFALEDHFGITFEGDEMASLDSFDRLVQAVEKQRAAQS